VTGLSQRSWLSSPGEPGPHWRAHLDARLADRPRQRAVGAGLRDRLVFVDRSLVTLVQLRYGVTPDVLAG
jgi:hypothetical protein